MRRVFWWAVPCAASFLAYFTLLVFCDVDRPVPEGLDLQPRAELGGLLVKDVLAGSPAAAAGIRSGDVILRADGHRLDSRMDWEAVQLTVGFGRTLTLDVLRGESTQAAGWQVSRAGAAYWQHRPGIELLVTRLVQLVTLLLGLVVVFRRPHDFGARVGGWLLATFGVFCVTLPSRIADVWGSLPAALGAALWLPFASSVVLPALLLSFFLVFPRRTVRAPLAWVAIWLPALVIGLTHCRFYFDVVYRPSADWTPFIGFELRWTVWIGYLVATAVVAVVTYRHLDAPERRRLGVMMLGGGVGAASGGPIAFAFWQGSETGLFTSPAIAIAILCLLAVPLSFAYAILRHRLFDVRFIIRQGVRYALARRLLVWVVPAALLVLGADVYLHRARSIGEQFGARAPIYLLVAAGAVVAQAYRQRWLDALDRRFFRERYDAQRLLHRIVDELARAAGLPAVAGLVVDQIAAALHPDFVTLLTRAHGRDVYERMAGVPDHVGPAALPGDARLLTLASVVGKPLDLGDAGSRWLASNLQSDAAMVGEAGIEVVVPVGAVGDRADAILVLGRRKSEEPYAAEDLALLWTVARSLAALAGRDRAGLGVPGTFAECPACGRCYDPGEPRCADDGSALAAVGLPRLLAGRYRLDGRLGRGGMGIVYAASDLSLDRDVAVKVLREELVGDTASAARFEREARIAARFTHGHVVTVHDFGIIQGSRAFLVMERLHGATLREELAHAAALAPGRVLAIMRGVCSAVDAGHRRGLVHRDLKPENVFLARSDGEETPKILDFGIAKVQRGDPQEDRRETRAGALLGTPEYMAPEQLRGEPVASSWDLWSLGVMTFEMLTGYHPFATLAIGLSSDGVPTATPAAGTLGRVPAAWQPSFARWLSVDPAGRPESAAALLTELEEMLSRGRA